MARRKQNPINDIVDTVGAWLGGNRGTINPQVQRVQRDLGTVAQTIDTFGTGGVGQALVSDAQRMAATGSSTPTALYKTAAVNLGAAATGVAAAKVAGKVVEAGVVARAANKVRGEVVGLHGSPVKGLKEIEPRLSQWAVKGSSPKVYSANPSHAPSNAPRGAGVWRARETAQDYALGYSAPSPIKEPGSIYVVAGKTDKTKAKNPLIYSSSKPMRVVAEVEVMDPLRNAKVNQALRRAGVKVPKKK